jgi:uncharacterized protein
VHGLITRNTIIHAAAFLPPLLVGVWLGARGFKNTDPAVFRKYVLLILAGLAVVSLVKAVVAIWP